MWLLVIRYPSSAQYIDVCSALVTKYPCLSDRVVANAPPYVSTFT